MILVKRVKGGEKMKQKEWITVIIVVIVVAIVSSVVSDLITSRLIGSGFGSPALGSPAEGALGNYVGIANRVAKWMNSTTLTSSVITESSGSIGIGTASPAANYKLDVNGNLKVSGDINGGRIVTNSVNSANAPLTIGTGTMYDLRLSDKTVLIETAGSNYIPRGTSTTDYYICSTIEGYLYKTTNRCHT